MLGPDPEANEDIPLWHIMRSCDTWAAGRMMFELLLQCVKRQRKATRELGLPPLGRHEYKQADLPPLPGYSRGLREVLIGMIAFDPAQRLTPRCVCGVVECAGLSQGSTVTLVCCCTGKRWCAVRCCFGVVTLPLARLQ